MFIAWLHAWDPCDGAAQRRDRVCGCLLNITGVVNWGLHCSATAEGLATFYFVALLAREVFDMIQMHNCPKQSERLRGMLYTYPLWALDTRAQQSVMLLCNDIHDTADYSIERQERAAVQRVCH